MIDLKQHLPDFHLQDENFVKYIEALESVLNHAYSGLLEMQQQTSLHQRDEFYLDYFLFERGWKLRLPLSNDQKRALLSYMTPLNKYQGTTTSIIEVVYILYGVRLIPTLLDAEALGLWELEVSELGYNTYLDGDEPFRYKYLLTPETPVTDEGVKDAIRKIIDYLRPATIEYLLSWDVEDQEQIDRGFYMETSELDWTTFLHED
jgi:hypothetical protein